MSDDPPLDDPVVEAQELKKRIIAVREDQVFTKNWVITGFCVMMVPLLLTLGLVVGITFNTNRAVKRQVLPLQHRVTDLESTVEAQESIITQSTDAIVQLLGLLRANGIEPPNIIIRPEE